MLNNFRTVTLITKNVTIVKCTSNQRARIGDHLRRLLREILTIKGVHVKVVPTVVRNRSPPGVNVVHPLDVLHR